MTSVISAALDYHGLGWSVIPIARMGKRPLLPQWAEYQIERASADQITEWFGGVELNIGVVTGAVSGLLVLDCDGPDGEASLASLGGVPVTLMARTGKGFHYYFKHPGKPVANKVRIKPGLDVRADGGYVVAPPSVHSSGSNYEWVNPTEDVSECPQWLLDLLDAPPEVPADSKPAGKDEWVDEAMNGVGEGHRNDTATKLVGYWLRQGVPLRGVRQLMAGWNLKNRPPLGDQELTTIVSSVAARESTKKMPDAPEKALEWINEQLVGSIQIEWVRKKTGEQPVYEIMTDRGLIQPVRWEDMETFPAFKRLIGKRLDLVLPNTLKAVYDQLFAGLIKLVISVKQGDSAEVNEDKVEQGTRVTLLREWLMAACSNVGEKPSESESWQSNGYLHIHLRWVHWRLTQELPEIGRLTVSDLNAMLQTIGFVSRRQWVNTESSKSYRRVHTIEYSKLRPEPEEETRV